MSLEVPDLTSYNLTNAAEKLEVERMAGLFSNENAQTQVALDMAYTNKLREILAGVETDWLAQPVRNGFGHKHSLYFEEATRPCSMVATSPSTESAVP
jgi:hypothetical protein